MGIVQYHDSFHSAKKVNKQRRAEIASIETTDVWIVDMYNDGYTEMIRTTLPT